MKHALTGSTGDGHVYRNWYAASKGHHSEYALKSLVSKGLMKVGRVYCDGNYYHCTESGSAFVGLHLPDNA